MREVSFAMTPTDRLRYETSHGFAEDELSLPLTTTLFFGQGKGVLDDPPIIEWVTLFKTESRYKSLLHLSSMYYGTRRQHLMKFSLSKTCEFRFGGLPSK